MTFSVGVTADFYDSEGGLVFPQFDISALEQRDIKLETIAAGDELPPAALRNLDGLIVLRPQVTKKTLESASRLKVVARFGVGYERVDIQACTDNGIVLATTPGAASSSVAQAELAMMLALSLRLMERNQLARNGSSGWSKRAACKGIGLVGRTLGIIGMGAIAQELVRITKPFGLRYVAYDPFANEDKAANIGVILTDLHQVLDESDILSINCPYTTDTAGMIGEDELSRMKKTAFVINAARGGIIDEDALAAALSGGQLAGAALDVFETEPLSESSPLLQCPNTILTPHSLGWTDQLFEAIGRGVIDNILAVAMGKLPPGIVNREVGESVAWRGSA